MPEPVPRAAPSPEPAVYFVAGLPRSGSTLLMNILGQNPQFHVTPTSGILEILVTTRNQWRTNEAFRALPRGESQRLQIQVLRAAFRGYFEHVDGPVAFDKNRIWLEYLELAALLVGGRDKLRVLVTVRDLRDVLASFEVLYRNTSATGQIPQEQLDVVKMKTALGRIEIFSDTNQPVGRAYNAIRDAVTRGFGAQMLFIEYDALTGAPAATMARIYEFLGHAPFAHDFGRVEQRTFEDDTAYGFKDLHTIRPVVAPQAPRWSTVYDTTVVDSEVWRNVEKAAQFWRMTFSDARTALPPGS